MLAPTWISIGLVLVVLICIGIGYFIAKGIAWHRFKKQVDEIAVIMKNEQVDSIKAKQIWDERHLPAKQVYKSKLQERIEAMQKQQKAKQN